MYKNSKCLTWRISTVFFWWLFLACNAFYFNLPYNRFAHITFYTQSKRLLLTILHCSLLHWKQLRPWEVCSLDDPWTFAASNSLMHSIHRCTWKSLQFFIITIMMQSHSCVCLKKLVFHQSQVKALAPSSVYFTLLQCIYPRFLSCICVFFSLFTMHVESLAFCVWEWRRYTIQYNAIPTPMRATTFFQLIYLLLACERLFKQNLQGPQTI